MKCYNSFARNQNKKIMKMGYKPKDTGTTIALILSELIKFGDFDIMNPQEKLADITLRIFDYIGSRKIVIKTLPDVEINSKDEFYKAMRIHLNNELESSRAQLNIHIDIIYCLAYCFKYAECNNINLQLEMVKKQRKYKSIKKKIF